MKILVTGAYGQLGSELKERSVDFPDRKFIFTDIDSLDIIDNNMVEAYFRDKRPDFIINCAAYTAVDKAESDPHLAEKVNSLAPGFLAKAAKRLHAGMIHISTDYVYSGESFIPYNEADPVNPQTVYGKTKLEGERLCLAGNPDTVIIRTSWLYSFYGNNFVKKILQHGELNSQVKVVFDQTGTPTWASDLAAAVIAITEKFAENRKYFIPGIYNFSNEGVASWYDFAKAVFEISGIDCDVIPVLSSEFPTQATRPHYTVLNKFKIKTTFGIDIPYWKESLKKCLNKIQNIK
jgi:dTDP-4-dehydrorhamnose reductase